MPLIALSLSCVAEQLMLQFKNTDLGFVELFSVTYQPLACGICFQKSLANYNMSCFSRSIVALVDAFRTAA